MQHLPAQIELLKSGKAVYWGDADELVAQAGPLRYVKDAIAVFFLFYWASVALQSKRVFVGRFFTAASSIAFGLCCIGVIGHFLDVNIGLFIAGMRWIVHLTAAMGLIAIFYEYNLWGNEKIIKKFERIFFIILASNAFYVFLQTRSYDVGRYTGLFSNSGVMATYVYGISLCVSFLFRKSLLMINFSYLLIFYSIVKSGSRAFIILSIFTWMFVMARRLTSKARLLMIVLIPFLLAGVWWSVSYAEKSADRGAIIATQVESGGRLSNVLDFFKSFSDIPAIDVIFGKGLGYGTNNAFSVNIGSQSFHPWFTLIDNGYVTWIMQFGMVGFLGLIFLQIRYSFALFRYGQRNPELVSIVVPCLLALPFLMFVQNPFEQFGFVVSYAMACSWIVCSGERLKPVENTLKRKNHLK
ncbi:O-antigen ligase family protein [Oleiharenicola lentus]|uniref:O-antigen ligase family protein n=1 Tax=Oleiharenicola lentus TaxID=2508720 RepID=UPI003F665B27